MKKLLQTDLQPVEDPGVVTAECVRQKRLDTVRALNVEELRINFGQMLRSFKREGALLSRMSGITESSLYKYSHGIHDPKIYDALKIARVLDMSVEEMVGLRSRELGNKSSIVSSKDDPEQYFNILIPELDDAESRSDIYYFNGQIPSILTCPQDAMIKLNTQFDIPIPLALDTFRSRINLLTMRRMKIVDLLSRDWLNRLKTHKKTSGISDDEKARTHKGLTEWLGNLISLLENHGKSSMRYFLKITDKELSGSFRLCGDELVMFLPDKTLIQFYNRGQITAFQDRLQHILDTAVSDPTKVLGIVREWLTEVEQW